jgi:hypothetical protein
MGPGGWPSPLRPCLVYAVRFNFAQRARCAAAIRLRPAIEMVRFGFGAWPFAFAHRGFCARLIFLRPAADIVRDAPLELLPSAGVWAELRARTVSLRAVPFQ